jgi:hypothetical protein
LPISRIRPTNKESRKPTENIAATPISLLDHIQKCGRGLAPDCAGSVARCIG